MEFPTEIQGDERRTLSSMPADRLVITQHRGRDYLEEDLIATPEGKGKRKVNKVIAERGEGA